MLSTVTPLSSSQKINSSESQGKPQKNHFLMAVTLGGEGGGKGLSNNKKKYFFGNFWGEGVRL